MDSAEREGLLEWREGLVLELDEEGRRFAVSAASSAAFESRVFPRYTLLFA